MPDNVSWMPPVRGSRTPESLTKFSKGVTRGYVAPAKERGRSYSTDEDLLLVELKEQKNSHGKRSRDTFLDVLHLHCRSTTRPNWNPENLIGVTDKGEKEQGAENTYDGLHYCIWWSYPAVLRPVQFLSYLSYRQYIVALIFKFKLKACGVV